MSNIDSTKSNNYSATSNNNIVMYIVVNEELNMSPGKIASQVGHIVQIIVDELVSNIYEGTITSEESLNYTKWKNSPIKIILKARGYKFSKLLELETSRYFTDTGRTTQNTDGKITVIGFYPSSSLADLFISYDLVK